MADFNRKKLQVFVSSTFSDLIRERQAAVEAILAAGHIPAGMELFTSGDESQMEVIKQWIDESDVYVLILGGRYGSVEPKTGKSYTQLEYEYALEKGKPLFACVMDESIIDTRVSAQGKGVLELDNPQKFKDFRAEVLTKIIKFWTDAKDIKLTIIEKLSLLARRDDLIGWVRASSQSENPTALSDEFARLSKENAQLREQVGHKPPEATFSGVTFPQLKELLDRAGLVRFLFDNRINLLSGMTGRTEVMELYKYNLLVRNESRGYLLSETGKAFLTRLEVEHYA
jgi:hypothetical protein